MRVCVYVYTIIFVQTRVCIYVHGGPSTETDYGTLSQIYFYIFIYIYMYMCMYVCVRVCECVCVCAYIYTYTAARALEQIMVHRVKSQDRRKQPVNHETHTSNELWNAVLSPIEHAYNT